MMAQPEFRLDRLLRFELALLIFVIVLILFPYIRDPAVDTKIFLYTWTAGLLTVVCIIGRVLKNQPFHRPRLVLEILLAWLGWFIIAGALSRFPANSFEEISKFLALFLLYFVASQIYRTPEQVQRLLLVVCAAISISVLYGIIQYAGLDPFPWNPEQSPALKEAPGTFGNGNLASHATVLGIVMAAYLAARRRAWWPLGFAALFFVHLNLSQQRGGIVGLLAAGALILLTISFYRRTQRPLRAIATGFLVMAVLAVMSVAGVMGLMKLRTGVAYPTSLPILLRYHGYSGAAQMIFKHPLLGYGPGNYRYENPAFWTPFEQEHFALKHKMNFRAHNDALEIGTEAGLPVAGLYLAFLIVATASGLLMALTHKDPARRRLGFMFAAFFCTFMVDGFFGFNLRAPVSAVLLFVMAGALEGTWLAPDAPVAPARPAPQRRLATVAATGLCAVAVATCVFQTRVIYAEFLFQRAAGATYYEYFREADNLLARGEPVVWWRWEFPYQRGEIALRQYQPREAIEHYERARALNPEFPVIPVALAHSHVMLAELGMADQPFAERFRMLDQAKAYAEDALKWCPPLPEGEDMLGRTESLRATLLQQQAKAGQMPAEARAAWQEAEIHLRRAIDDKARQLDRVYVMLARARMALGDNVGAQDALIRAAGVNPANTTLWPVFAQFADAVGQQATFRDAVLKSAAKLRDDGKDLPPALDALATAWSSTPGCGIGSAAAAFAKAATDLLDKQKGAPLKDNFSWAADVLLQEANHAQMPEQGLSLVQYHLGLVYASASQWAKADAVFTTCWKQLPDADASECALVWAETLMQLKQQPRAATMLREALARLKSNPRVQLALARVLAKSGRAAEARIEYELILSQYRLGDCEREMIRGELTKLPTGGK